MLNTFPTDPLALLAFERASHAIVEWWNAESEREDNQRRDLEIEAAVSERLGEFAMRTTAANARTVLEPLLDAVDQHPREIHSFVEGLTIIEDSRSNTAHYWFLWGLFAKKSRDAGWIHRLDDERSLGTELLSAIFLTSGWKDSIRHWRSLEGFGYKVQALLKHCRHRPLYWKCTCDFFTTSASSSFLKHSSRWQMSWRAAMRNQCCERSTQSPSLNFYCNDTYMDGLWS